MSYDISFEECYHKDTVYHEPAVNSWLYCPECHQQRKVKSVNKRDV